MSTIDPIGAQKRHLWIVGPSSFTRAGELARIATPQLVVDAHRRLRGPYTAAGAILRLIIPDVLRTGLELVQQHDVEILTAAPELEAVLANRRATLTSMAEPDERTRFYPRAHTTRIAHGLCELLLEWAHRQQSPITIMVDRLCAADPTDAELVAIMLRRSDPATLRLVVGTVAAALPEPLAEALARHAALRRTIEPPARAPADGRSDATLAAAYVAAECASEDPAEQQAYERLSPAERESLHDAWAAELEARGEVSLRLGAIPFHHEHGRDPAGAGFTAVCAALERCVLTGCYHAVIDLGARALELIEADVHPEDAWLVTAKVVTALTALGRPEEAQAEYDRACAATTLASAHLQAAYGRAMLYTRFFEDARRDHAKAKAWINTAIAIAELLPEPAWRAFNVTLNENGLALIEMHLGDPARALTLIEAGLARLDRDLGPDDQTLHRSVLRYNRAQLLHRMGTLEAALEAYDELIRIDPNHSEYHLERAAILRKLGRDEHALADLDEAIRLSPPYPEPYYNRGDLRLDRGEPELAAADFSRVLELDPAFVDAYLNRASALCELDELDAAAADVAAGLRLAPDSPHLHGLHGVILHHRGQLAEADRAYAKALHHDPRLSAVWVNRAALAFDRGDAADAIAHLDRTIKIDGPLPELLENRARAQEQVARHATL